MIFSVNEYLLEKLKSCI